MNSSGKIVVLPDRDEMERRLLSVSKDSHRQEHFYPILLRNAGQERVAGDVALNISYAINDYVQGLPPTMANLMYMLADDYIDALVDDTEVAQEAKDLLQEGLNAVRGG